MIGIGSRDWGLGVTRVAGQIPNPKSLIPRSICRVAKRLQSS